MLSMIAAPAGRPPGALEFIVTRIKALVAVVMDDVPVSARHVFDFSVLNRAVLIF